MCVYPWGWISGIWGEDGCRNSWGSLCLGPCVGWGGRFVSVPPRVPPSPCPWLCWELALGTAAQPETHRCEATALGFLLRVSPGGLK